MDEVQEEIVDQMQANNRITQETTLRDEFVDDWEEEIEEDPNSLSQVQRRQINTNSDCLNLKCKVLGMVCTTAIFQDRYLFCGTSQNHLFCYDTFSHKILFEDYKHSDWVLSLQILRINNYDLIISGGGLYDRTLCFYDLSSIDQSKVVFIDQKLVHKKSVTKMLYIEDKQILITCGSDYQFKMWKISIDIKSNSRKFHSKKDNEEDENNEIIDTNNNQQENNEQDNQNVQKQMSEENEEEEENKVNNSMDCSLEEHSNLQIKLKQLQCIYETSQVYSLCESEDNLIVYGTQIGLIKIIKYYPKANKIRQVRSMDMEKSIWCLQRFSNFKYIVGCSFQTEGRISIINIVTGQHIMNFFKPQDCIHSFRIISKINERSIIIKNKEEFIIESRNSITLVGASKLGKVMIANIGDKIKTPIEHVYEYNPNTQWIPWNPISLTQLEIDENYPQFSRYRIYCSTGNYISNFNKNNMLSQIIYFDLAV